MADEVGRLKKLEKVSCNETVIWRDPIPGALEIPPHLGFERIDGNANDNTGLGQGY